MRRKRTEEEKAKRRAKYRAWRDAGGRPSQDELEAARERRARYRKENPGFNREYMAKWRAENRDKIMAYRERTRPEMAEWRRNRRATDRQAKIRDNLRARLNAAIRNKCKTGSAVRDLGCSIPEFMAYMEGLFCDGMNWENMGRTGWHIDHIVPLGILDLTDPCEFRRACHYTNLQPMWALDNIRKGRRAS